MRTEPRRLSQLELACPLAALPFLIFPSVLSALALVVLLVPWAVRWRIYGRPTARTPMDVPILCLMLMVPVSLWASALPEVSLPKLLGIMLGVAFFYAVVNSVRSSQGLIWVWAALSVALGVVISCLALVGTDWFTHKMLPLGPVYQRLPRLIDNIPGSISGGFHPNEVGGALALLLPVSVAALLVVWSSNPGIEAGAITSVYPIASPVLRTRWARVLLSRKTLVVLTGLCCVLMAGVLILTQSRSAYMGMAVGLVVLGAFRRRWILFLLPLLALVALVLVWSLGAQSILDGVLMLDTTGTANGRFEVWQRAVYMLQDFPYTGVGLNTFPYVGDAMYPYFLLGPDARVPHAHNNFLQVGVDLGIPGAVAYLALLTTFFVCAWRVFRATQSTSIQLLTAGLFSGMLAHQVYGLSDAITLGAKPGFLLWIILGMVAALYTKRGVV
jgi:putative inorganic carbon (HCO3(-)) transporter